MLKYSQLDKFIYSLKDYIHLFVHFKYKQQKNRFRTGKKLLLPESIAKLRDIFGKVP